MSRLEESSRKDNQDKKLTMGENLPKEKTSEKTGDTNAPKMPVLNTSSIIGCTYIMPPQEYGQKFQVRIVKMVDEHDCFITITW